MENRKIIHVDMDMFYAAVEILDNPKLAKKPVIVGGRPDSRGVVATANYEARKYGVRSAMSCAEAYRLCPHGVFVSPRSTRYKEISQQVRNIFFEYTELVEPLSLDEAYLDVTNSKYAANSATWIAKQIKANIFQTTKLTASAGVAPNKFIAKIASDYNKPDGLCVVRPEKVCAFIYPLPVIKVPGIGKITNKKLERMGIKTIQDLSYLPLDKLLDEFGKQGSYLFNIAKGIDLREVTPLRVPKSYGRERTFSQDMTDINEINDYLEDCATKVFHDFSRKGIKARTITLKIKYNTFVIVTRSATVESGIYSTEQIITIVKELLQKTEVGKIPIRLAGISLSGFDNQHEEKQMEFDFVKI